MRWLAACLPITFNGPLMKHAIYFLALLLPLLTLGCEKTVHEATSPLPIPSASLALR